MKISSSYVHRVWKETDLNNVDDRGGFIAKSYYFLLASTTSGKAFVVCVSESKREKCVREKISRIKAFV